jgi:hypothetical protein
MVHGRLAGACAGGGPTAFKQRAVAEGVGADASPQGEQRVRQGIDPPGGEGGEFSKITKGPIPVSGYFFGFRTYRGCADGVCVRLGI